MDNLKASTLYNGNYYVNCHTDPNLILFNVDANKIKEHHLGLYIVTTIDTTGFKCSCALSSINVNDNAMSLNGVISVYQDTISAFNFTIDNKGDVRCMAVNSFNIRTGSVTDSGFHIMSIKIFDFDIIDNLFR